MDRHPHYRPHGAFGQLPRPATIQAVREENAYIRTLVLDVEMPTARPGQFVMVWLPGLEEAPFSLAGVTPVELTIARVGLLTEALHRLGPGEQIWLRGPFGRPFTPEPTARRPLLVGGGYGVAPLAFLAAMLIAHHQQPIALVGGRRAEDIIALDRWKALGIPVVVTTEDGSLGERGLVTQPVERLLREGEGDAIYGVGPEGMLEALETLARTYRVPAQLSWVALIGCGMGICGKCERHSGQLVCVDGPVFRVVPR